MTDQPTELSNGGQADVTPELVQEILVLYGANLALLMARAGELSPVRECHLLPVVNRLRTERSHG